MFSETKSKMKSLLSLTILFIVFSIYSCKKDKKVEPVEELVNTSGTTYPNYSNLKVGNYWIYERFRVDSMGSAISIGIVDSCFIDKDTMIRGNTYYKMTGPDYTNPTTVNPIRSAYLRDSLNYLINNYGDIVFSTKDVFVLNSGYNITPPNDTVYSYITKMTDQNMSITVPSGTYRTINLQTSFTFYNNYIIYWKTRTKNTRYAENVGMVSQDWGFFISMPDYWQRQLIRYHFN